MERDRHEQTAAAMGHPACSQRARRGKLGRDERVRAFLISRE
jgi:hypothetical protein